MIEGVNATIANASLARPVVEQAEQVRSSYAANPKQIQQIPQAPYVSPYIAMDYDNNKAVLQFRDSDTGEVVTQIPTDTQLRAYHRAQQVPQSERNNPATPNVKADEPKVAVKAETPEPKVEAPKADAPQTDTSVLVDA